MLKTCIKGYLKIFDAQPPTFVDRKIKMNSQRHERTNFKASNFFTFPRMVLRVM